MSLSSSVWMKIFLLLFTIKLAQSQIWEGEFIADDTCTPAGCCCFGPNITMTRSGSDSLTVSIGLFGQCLGQTYYTGSAAYPTSFTLTNSLSVVTITSSLSSDSNVLEIRTSLSATCVSRAFRTNPFTTTTSTAGPNRNNNGRRQKVAKSFIFTLLAITLLRKL